MKTTLKKAIYILLIALISTGYQVWAASRVAVYHLQAPTMSDQTVQSVDNLVYSFIKELKNYSIIDLRTETAPQVFPPNLAAEFLFFGVLEEVPQGIRLELVLKGRENQLTRVISKVYDNLNKILLDSRLLVLNLFDFSVTLEKLADMTLEDASGADLEPVETIDSLAGSWKGEGGLDRVMILRGGRGMALFSSGVSVSLEFKIENGYLLVTQKGALQPRQFLNLPDSIAKEATQKVQPPRWRFLVSADKKMLSGTKVDAQIRYNDSSIIDIQYETADVEWLRD